MFNLWLQFNPCVQQSQTLIQFFSTFNQSKFLITTVLILFKTYLVGSIIMTMMISKRNVNFINNNCEIKLDDHSIISDNFLFKKEM